LTDLLISLSNFILWFEMPCNKPRSIVGFLDKSKVASSPFNTPTFRICLSRVLALHIANPLLYSFSRVNNSSFVGACLSGLWSKSSLLVLVYILYADLTFLRLILSLNFTSGWHAEFMSYVKNVLTMVLRLDSSMDLLLSKFMLRVVMLRFLFVLWVVVCGRTFLRKEFIGFCDSSKSDSGIFLMRISTSILSMSFGDIRPMRTSFNFVAISRYLAVTLSIVWF